MSWSEQSPYRQSPDVLARWSTALERAERRRRVRRDRVLQAIIAACFVVVAVAWGLSWGRGRVATVG